MLTFLTLRVLRRYADDTKKIADVSSSQTENSQMPFLAVMLRMRPDNEEAGWGIENQGFGPALNVMYRISGRRSSIGSLSEGAIQATHGDIADAFAIQQPVLIDYESLSGKKYRTTVTMADTLMHRFEKL